MLSPEFEKALAAAVAEQRAHDLGISTEPITSDADIIEAVDEIRRASERMPTFEEMAQGLQEIAAGQRPSNIVFAKGGLLR